jgi:pSer/pThr/pTyr-binding forkhead associated (FHA) protein
MDNNEAPVLIIHEGKMAGQRWLLDAEVLTIGRAPDCDVSLVERPVSRYHARIRRLGDRFLIEDLGSKNGTFLNGNAVHGSAALQDGDEIDIAQCIKFLFVGTEATVPLRLVTPVAEGRLTVDRDQRQVWVNGEALDPPLSLAQFRLLDRLFQAQGAVCTRDDVVDTVWPETGGLGVSEQAIDALVRRLRDRLSELDAHDYVITVRGHGFRLDNPKR